MHDTWARAKSIAILFHSDESAQDLVEYALVAVVIGLAATAGMGAVAKEINAVFSNVAKKFVGSAPP